MFLTMRPFSHLMAPMLLSAAWIVMSIINIQILRVIVTVATEMMMCTITSLELNVAPATSRLSGHRLRLP